MAVMVVAPALASLRVSNISNDPVAPVGGRHRRGWLAATCGVRSGSCTANTPVPTPARGAVCKRGTRKKKETGRHDGVRAYQETGKLNNKRTTKREQ